MGPGSLLGEHGFVGAAEIAAPLNFAALGLQNLHRVVVAHARKRRLDGLQLGDVALQPLQLFAAILQHAAHDEDDHLFGHALHVFQGGVSHLGLHHPEFGQMAARLGFFGAEGGAEAVDLAERHGRGFVVELAGLRQVGLFVVEVIHFEKRGGAFAGRGGEDGRVDQGEAVGIEIVAHGLDDFVADADDGVLALAAQPEVAVIHQEIDAVLLGSDGVGVGFRNALQHLDVLDVHFEAAGGALFGAQSCR